MRIGNFSVTIPEGREIDSGHVSIPHNTKYTIRIYNHDYRRRVDTAVSVDGKDVGLFRVNFNGVLTLEHPAHDNGCFTFFEVASEDAQEAKVREVSKDNKGLVQVLFKPEKIRDVVKAPYQRVRGVGSSAGGQSVGGTIADSAEPILRGHSAFSDKRWEETSAGITGLTGHSDQDFYTVPNLDYDPSAEVTITLRLVCGKAVRKLTSVPPVVSSNPIPPPVE